ncbi:MAG TPA: flagellar biosynthesis anti-sigma factor FlgM [Kofleriaceae bacterium]|jgi:flagellar biosynthesis anti-sigma factor FlgM
MRIDNTPPIPTVSAEPRPARSTPRSESGSADVVTLSSDAAKATAADAPQTEKVARLRNAVATGQYKVDIPRLASAIVDDDAQRSGGK